MTGDARASDWATERLGAIATARAAGDHVAARQILAEIAVKLPLLFQVPGVWPVLAKPPPRFSGVGEGKAYFDYLLDLLRLADAACRMADASGDTIRAASLAGSMAQSFDFRLAAHSDEDIGPLMRLRAGLMRRALPEGARNFLEPLPPFDPARTRPRLAVLLRSLAEDPESTSLLPFFSGARDAGFAVTLFTFHDHHSGFRPLVEAVVDSIVEIPMDVVMAARRIRNEDADLLLFASDVTAKPSVGAFLSLLRLARLQMTAVSTLVTTQATTVDVYLGSPGHREIGAETEFSERYVDVPRPGFAFRFAPRPAPAQRFDRAGLGIDDDAVVLVSGANHTKLHRDLLDAWVRILSGAPRSVLLLYPFPKHFAVDTELRAHLERPFVEAGIDLRRIRLMPQLDGRDVVKTLLGICDLGLDSFPYPGVTTVVDAIDARLPTIALRGRTLRANQGAEILDSIGLGDLIAPDLDAYCRLAISYANDPQRRLDARARLDSAMLAPPMALDPDRFAAATASVLAGLVAELRKTGPMPDAAPDSAPARPPRHAESGKLETLMLSRPDGARICVHRMRASGPDLLLLGGYGRSSPLRKPIGATVLAFCKANRLGLAALEFRGQGGSSGALQRQTPADMRDDVLAVCRDLGLRRAIGLGASLGGWVMMAAQATEPTLLRGALLLAPAIDWDRHFILPAITAGRGIVQPDGDVAFPADNLLLGGSFMTGVEALRIPGGDLGMTGPLRVLHGGQDRIVPLATSTEFVARHGAHLPLSLRVLPTEGHGLSAGDTVQSAQAIGEELAALLAVCGTVSEA